MLRNRTKPSSITRSFKRAQRKVYDAQNNIDWKNMLMVMIMLMATVFSFMMLKSLFATTDDIDAATIILAEYSNDATFNAEAYLNKLQTEFKKNESDIFKVCESVINEGIDGNYGNGWSQQKQDQFVYLNFFKGQTDGIYVDIGANQPFTISNSAFFDVCLGWKGICVEPSKLSDTFWPRRSCAMAKKCAYNSTAQNLNMRWIFDQGVGSKVVGGAFNPNDSNSFLCDTISGTDLLNNYQPRNKYLKVTDLSANEANSNGVIIKKTIDYISLDVEGGEMIFLRCFPFKYYDVRIWSIEINKQGLESRVDALLYHNGYVKAKYMNTAHGGYLDAVYIQNDKNYILPYQEPADYDRYEKCE